jgi:dephospho-CoA kinase
VEGDELKEGVGGKKETHSILHSVLLVHLDRSARCLRVGERNRGRTSERRRRRIEEENVDSLPSARTR